MAEQGKSWVVTYFFADDGGKTQVRVKAPTSEEALRKAREAVAKAGTNMLLIERLECREIA